METCLTCGEAIDEMSQKYIWITSRDRAVLHSNVEEGEIEYTATRDYFFCNPHCLYKLIDKTASQMFPHQHVSEFERLLNLETKDDNRGQSGGLPGIGPAIPTRDE